MPGRIFNNGPYDGPEPLPSYVPQPKVLKGRVKKVPTTTTTNIPTAQPAATLPPPPAILMDDDDDDIDMDGVADTHGGGNLPSAHSTGRAVKPAPARAAKVLRPRAKKVVDRENQLATIPEFSYYDNYVGRDIAGMTYVEVFDHALLTATNVLVSGPTGSGKTMAVMAYAAVRKLPFYSFGSSGAVEPSQLFGKMLPTGDGKSLQWFDGPVPDIWRYGGVLLINEINFIPMRIATVMFSALDSRRVLNLVDHKGETIKAHRPECWCDLPEDICRSRWVLVIADMNPDYAGTQRMNPAFRNRFGIQLEWDYDDTVEAQLIESRNLLLMAKQIRTDSASAMVTPVSTNMLMEFEEIVINTGNLNFAKLNFRTHFEPRDRTFVDAVLTPHLGNIESDYQSRGYLD